MNKKFKKLLLQSRLVKYFKLDKKKIIIISFGLATALFSIFFIILLFSSVIFFLRGSINPFIFPLAVTVAFVVLIIFIWRTLKNEKKPCLIFSITILFIIIILCVFFSGLLYDVSWDGQDYHQPGIIKLYEGWNPYYEKQPEQLAFDPHVHIWVNHYPKGSWIIAASIYSFTGFLEHGKAINFIAIAGCFFLCLSLLLSFNWLPDKIAFFAALFLAFNPISSTQYYSYYVDGLTGSCLISLFIVCIYIINNKKGNIFQTIILASNTILVINLKFTGIVFVFFVFSGFCIGLFIWHKKITKVLSWAGICFVVTLVSIFLIGFSPFVRNFVDKGHPFYPLAGEDPIDIITHQRPKNFNNMNSLLRFGISLFGETENPFNMDTQKFEESDFKMPFSIRSHEFSAMSNGDARVAGFGPYFSGMLILMFILMVYLIYIAFKEMEWRAVICYLGVFIWILASVIINPESWWARFVPQLWILPLFFAVAAVRKRNHSMEIKEGKQIPKRRRVFAFLIKFLLYIAGINILFSFIPHTLKTMSWNESLQGDVLRMKESEKKVVLHMEKFEIATRIKLDRWKINYKEDYSREFLGRNSIIPQNWDDLYFKKSECKDLKRFLWTYHICEGCWPR